MLWIDITLMEFSFWSPAAHSTGPIYCLYWLGLQIVSSMRHICNPLEKTEMGDHLVTVFQQWWSAVPIDWRPAEAGRTPSLLLTQEECEVNLFQLHCALLLSAQVIWQSGCQEAHLITSSLPITCALSVSSFWRDAECAGCVAIRGNRTARRSVRAKSGKWLLATLLKIRRHCLCAPQC